MRKARSIAFLLMITIIAGGCKKDASDKLLGPGLVLSTDIPPHGWYPLKDFLKENGIKITFFVNSYQRLTANEIQKMREMEADGHEIAHHTTSHPHINEYLKSHTLDEYIQKEILDMSALMEKDGFKTTTFAYPYGEYTTASDDALLKHFSSIRKTINPYLSKHIEDMDPIYYRYGNIKILNACSIDENSRHSRDEVIDALEKAKSSRQTVAMYCHWIGGYVVSEGYPYSVSEPDLKAILLKAKSLGLRFYTVSEVSRKSI